jgi:excisionase family DNA binding protein
MHVIVENDHAQAGQGGAGVPEWIGVTEASRVLAVPPATVRRWVRDRWLSSRRVRHRLQVRQREVAELVSATVPAFDWSWRGC